MLTPQQIQLIKSSNSTSGSVTGVGSGAPMTPEQAKSSFSSSPTKSSAQGYNPVGMFASAIGDAAAAGANQIHEGYDQFKNANGNPVSMIEGGLKGASGAASIITSPIAPAMKPVSDAVNAVSDKISDVPAVQQFAGTGAGKVTANLAGDVANASNVAGTIAGGIEGAGKLSALKSDVVTPATVDTTASSPVLSTKVSPEVQAANRTALAEKISPKPTTAQAKIAMQQGRLVPGEKGGLLSEGTPDKIAASDQQRRAVATIDRLLPEHGSMSEPELYTALKGKIGDIANNLKPEMEKVPINQRTLEGINAKNAQLSKSLLEEAPATEEKNVIKRQAQFESFLKKSGNKNMNDLWDTAKAYDDSIPQRVKNANENSPESLQLQKSEWQQRRAILKQAINDTKNGLGAKSQQAFSDMTDMYSAQDGLLSKAKVNAEGEPSKVSQFLNTPKGKIIKAGVKATGLGAGLHFVP
jgi:hypothetical protein